MTIYTKTGDAGETSLFGNDRHSKSDPLFDILGTLDELNATLGLLHTVRIKEVTAIIIQTQNDLFELGAQIAQKHMDKESSETIQKQITQIETQIDAFDRELPELSNFILPGGAEASARLHLARAICRRLERQIVNYATNVAGRNEFAEILAYINRLSDLLFVLARYVNFKLGVKDQIWTKNS